VLKAGPTGGAQDVGSEPQHGTKVRMCLPAGEAVGQAQGLSSRQIVVEHRPPNRLDIKAVFCLYLRLVKSLSEVNHSVVISFLSLHNTQYLKEKD
jgi:hypothetical protein